MEMTARFEAILDESITALQAGVPLDEILAEVPEYAAELRPLLYAAMLLTDPQPQLAPEDRKAALTAEYLAQAAELPPVHPSLADQFKAVLYVIKRRFTPRAMLNDLATIAITVVLTLAMILLVLAYLSQDSLPGDFLYGVKQLTESGQLLLTPAKANRQELRDQFNQRRLTELEQLYQLHRAALVRFRGTLDSKSTNLWVVEGHTVFLPADVAVEGQPQEGDQVEVVGLLRSNRVIVADTIRLAP
jgi:hypothetical protein